MSAPTLHHLGLTGWHEGPDRPADTLITFERTIEPGIVNPERWVISYDVVWRMPGVSADNVNALLQQYPYEANLGPVADVSWETVR